jgi:hypothetical protein
MAKAGATIAALDMRKAAATREVAAFLTPSPLIILREVEEAFGVEGIVANPEAHGAHSRAVATRTDLENFILVVELCMTLLSTVLLDHSVLSRHRLLEA